MTVMRHGYSRSDGPTISFKKEMVDPETGEVTENPRTRCRTQQAFKDECDINRIMANYEKTGLINHLARYKGHYGDFTQVTDYHTALNIVAVANEMFATLPSAVRKRFSNSAGEFLEFVNDPANEEQIRELGLLPAKKAVAEPSPENTKNSGGPPQGKEDSTCFRRSESANSSQRGRLMSERC